MSHLPRVSLSTLLCLLMLSAPVQAAPAPACACEPETSYTFLPDELTPMQGVYTWAPGGGRRAKFGPLSARVLGDAGPPVVLLHGLAGSERYFGAGFDRIAREGRLIVPDLLGFGRSPQSTSSYTAKEHSAAVIAMLDAMNIQEPVILAGLSMGANLALHLAAAYPDRVASVIAMAPLIYRDRPEALAYLRTLDTMTSLMATQETVGRFLCEWSCAHRADSARIARMVAPALPPAITNDAVLHTYASYSGTLNHLVLDADAVGWAKAARCPIRIMVGTRDTALNMPLLRELGRDRPGIQIVPVAGSDHHIPLTQLDQTLGEIRRAMSIEWLKATAHLRSDTP